jgi:anti-sigma B factor antagonist
MEVRLEPRDGHTVVRPVGALDVYAAPRLRETMALLTTVPAVVIDLAEVSFVDSSGLAALVAGIRRIRDAGGDVAVCATRPEVRRLLELIGFERVVPMLRMPA